MQISCWHVMNKVWPTSFQEDLSMHAICGLHQHTLHRQQFAHDCILPENRQRITYSSPDMISAVQDSTSADLAMIFRLF